MEDEESESETTGMGMVLADMEERIREERLGGLYGTGKDAIPPNFRDDQQAMAVAQIVGGDKEALAKCREVLMILFESDLYQKSVMGLLRRHLHHPLLLPLPPLAKVIRAALTLMKDIGRQSLKIGHLYEAVFAYETALSLCADSLLLPRSSLSPSTPSSFPSDSALRLAARVKRLIRMWMDRNDPTLNDNPNDSNEEIREKTMEIREKTMEIREKTMERLMEAVVPVEIEQATMQGLMAYAIGYMGGYDEARLLLLGPSSSSLPLSSSGSSSTSSGSLGSSGSVAVTTAEGERSKTLECGSVYKLKELLFRDVIQLLSFLIDPDSLVSSSPSLTHIPGSSLSFSRSSRMSSIAETVFGDRDKGQEKLGSETKGKVLTPLGERVVPPMWKTRVQDLLEAFSCWASLPPSDLFSPHETLLSQFALDFLNHPPDYPSPSDALSPSPSSSPSSSSSSSTAPKAKRAKRMTEEEEEGRGQVERLRREMKEVATGMVNQLEVAAGIFFRLANYSGARRHCTKASDILRQLPGSPSSNQIFMQMFAACIEWRAGNYNLARPQFQKCLEDICQFVNREKSARRVGRLQTADLEIDLYQHHLVITGLVLYHMAVAGCAIIHVRGRKSHTTVYLSEEQHIYHLADDLVSRMSDDHSLHWFLARVRVILHHNHQITRFQRAMWKWEDGYPHSSVTLMLDVQSELQRLRSEVARCGNIYLSAIRHQLGCIALWMKEYRTAQSHFQKAYSFAEANSTHSLITDNLLDSSDVSRNHAIANTDHMQALLTYIQAHALQDQAQLSSAETMMAAVVRSKRLMFGENSDSIELSRKALLKMQRREPLETGSPITRIDSQLILNRTIIDIPQWRRQVWIK